MRTLAEKLQRLTPRDPNQIALLGFMVGVLYSLAGFYLDSALMRLAALNERIDTYLGKKHDTAQQIRRLVNEIKHEVDAGIGQGWTIKF